MALLTVLISAAMIGQSSTEGTRTRANGLEVVSFQRPEGRVIVYLPDDLSAGDTISGSVATLPNGEGAERAKNDGVLRGMVVSLSGTGGSGKGDSKRWIIPATLSTDVAVTLNSPDGSPGGSCQVPLAFGASGPGGPMFVDPIIEGGKPIRVSGSFDGDHDNTQLTFPGDGVAIPVAESPRSMIFATAEKLDGPVRFKVTENGIQTECSTNAVGIQLESPKVNLLQGESTRLVVKLTGLQGLKAEDYPIPLELVNYTPSIVQIEGVAGKYWNGEVRYTDVAVNGRAQFTFNLTGLTSGPFTIRGLLFAVSLHDAKAAMTTEMFNNWVAGLIATYTEKIKALQEQLKDDPESVGLKANIERKEKVLESLNEWKRTTAPFLGSAKTAVDKALALDNMFSVAADLITIAAEMLGYTDLPIPGVGTALKGAKALFSKYPKVIDSISAAEKIIDEYNKIVDAAEKKKKLEELKEALEKVKEAAEAAK